MGDQNIISHRFSGFISRLFNELNIHIYTHGAIKLGVTNIKSPPLEKQFSHDANQYS
jgi:hypothetical protein